MACCLTVESHYLNQCWLLTHNRWSTVVHVLTLDKFHRNCTRYAFMVQVWKICLWNTTSPSGQLLKQWCQVFFALSHLDDVITWKHFPRYWPFVWRIHRSPVNSPHKGQWRRALMFRLICARTNGRVNNRGADNLRRHHAHYAVSVTSETPCIISQETWTTLGWRHNGLDSVSNHQPHHCLLNRWFRRRSKKTSKLRVTGLCEGIHRWPVNSPHKWPVTRKMFPFDDVIMMLELFCCGLAVSIFTQIIRGRITGAWILKCLVALNYFYKQINITS